MIFDPDRTRASWLQECLSRTEKQEAALLAVDFCRCMRRIGFLEPGIAVVEVKALQVLSKVDWQS